MFLKKLKILSFKNLEEIELILSEKLNCFTGNNGAGKTNILDAVYYLSFTKSYFNTSDSQNIQYDKEFFVLYQFQFLTCDNQIYVSILNQKFHYIY